MSARPRDRSERDRRSSSRPEGLILIDIPPGTAEEFDTSFLERTGHPVVVCRGPSEQPCPLLTGEGCPKFQAAHGIVFQLDLEQPEHRAIVERYLALSQPGRPIRVVVSPEQTVKYRDTLAGVELWPTEPTVADLDGFAARVEAVDRDRSCGRPSRSFSG